MEWLRGHNEQIAGLVVHPESRSRFASEIAASAGIDPSLVFDGSRLSDPGVREVIARLRPDIGISILFGYILTNDFLALMPAGCVNLHPSLLPYNRGAHPNVWSIVERTPAGVTLHYVDDGIDTGDIVAQKEILVGPADTGKSLYEKLEDAAFGLFTEAWPGLRQGRAPRLPQRSAPGTCHRTRDLSRIDEIDPDRFYRAGDLIDILRARTFPPYPGAYFIRDGRKILLRIELEEEK